jgi:phage RecT family recombinase
MSNLVLFEKSKSLIEAQAKKFTELAKSHKAVNFEQEAHFALQALRGNDFLAKTAAENPDSLIAAVHNIASVGLSLNPALKHAYLVPRDGKVCLDFGYKGLAHLAIDAGSVLYVQAELTFSKDKFILRGRGQEPVHERDPFNPDRGDLVGVYCIAETDSGKFLVETMTIKEVYAIRDRTQAYKAFKAGKVKSCPWVSDDGEMVKKTAIRRASKSWPMKNAKSDRLEKAMLVHDENEAVDVTPISSESTPVIEGPNPKFQEIRDLLSFLGKEEEKFIGYLSTVNNRKIEQIEDLSQKETETALVQLNAWKKTFEEKNKKESANENPQ